MTKREMNIKRASDMLAVANQGVTTAGKIQALALREFYRASARPAVDAFEKLMKSSRESALLRRESRRQKDHTHQMQMNTNRTHQEIPPEILEAIDHVRKFFPVVDLVVFNDVGRWQFMGEDYERVAFGDQLDNIDLGLLERASNKAYDLGGHPSVYQAYTSENF